MKDTVKELITELEDHFSDELYGMKLYFIEYNPAIKHVPMVQHTVDKLLTVFEYCRINIVKDVVDISDTKSEYKHYYFLIEDVKDDVIRYGRLASLEE